MESSRPGSCRDGRHRDGPQPQHPADHLQLGDEDPVDRKRGEGDGRHLGVAGLADRRQSRKVKL